MKKDKLKCAVIGVGYLGKFHAEKYASLEDVDLIAVSDINRQNGKNIAAEHKCDFHEDYKELIGKCDIVSIAVPSCLHYEIGTAFLKNGTHCLIEKPFATTMKQAREMQKLAEDKSLVLGIGHIERFNPAFTKIKEMDLSPEYITSERLSLYSPRSKDINVILDLMIHDIDLILQLIDSPIKDIHCIGIKLISQYTDSANAHIIFENGSIANIHASRVSLVRSRKMRILQPKLYASANFDDRSCFIARAANEDEMLKETHDLSDTGRDNLLSEISDFIEAVREGKEPLTTAESAIATLRAAIKICDDLNETFD